jgi:hypothetical protein
VWQVRLLDLNFYGLGLGEAIAILVVAMERGIEAFPWLGISPAGTATQENFVTRCPSMKFTTGK